MMLRDVKADFARYCRIESGSTDLSFLRKIRVWFHGYGLQALATQRFYRWSLQGDNLLVQLCKGPLIVIGFFLNKIVVKLYDINISRHARIGPGCYIGHFGGIRIGRCRVGKFCNINHQVSIEEPDDTEQQVVIGERVWIGAHSIIKQGVHIGNSVTVSAGSIVKTDIVDNVLVAGPSARVLKRDYDNTALLGQTE